MSSIYRQTQVILAKTTWPTKVCGPCLFICELCASSLAIRDVCMIRLEASVLWHILLILSTYAQLSLECGFVSVGGPINMEHE
jgi:hypothetical protein